MEYLKHRSSRPQKQKRPATVLPRRGKWASHCEREWPGTRNNTPRFDDGKQANQHNRYDGNPQHNVGFTWLTPMPADLEADIQLAWDKANAALLRDKQDEGEVVGLIAAL